MRISVNDRSSFKVTSREYTDEGYLRVRGRVARCGMQEYRADELGLTDRPASDIIRVYRPAEEVFKDESLRTYDGADITNDHPTELVNCDTYKTTTKGTIRGVGVRDGDFIIAELIIKSKDAITAVEQGKNQLSAGYSAEYVEASDDQPYDFIQRDIKINHVAIVHAARAGIQARIFDNKRASNMPVMVMLDSGRTVDAADPTNAAVVADTIDRLRTSLDASMKKEEEERAKASEAEAKADKAEAKADETAEQLEKEKAKTSDAAISERLAVITSTLADARKIAGDSFTSDSVDVLTIQREALKVVRDSVDWSEKSEVYVQASFDMAVESPAESQTYTQLSKDGATVKTDDAAPVTGYQKFKDNQAQAWSKKLGA